jgi:signal transduction histidine kinase/CheY-like chemotaxis protein
MPLPSVVRDEGLLLLSLTGIVQEVNQPALALLGLPRTSLLGGHIGTVLSEFAQFDWRRLIASLMLQGRVDPITIQHERTCDPYRAVRVDTHLEARFFLCEAPHEQRLAMLLGTRETARSSDLALRAYAAELQSALADRARRELALTEQSQELALAREQLTRQARIAATFLENLGQKYRRPLMSLLGYVDLLSREKTAATCAPWLQAVRRNAEYLLSHLDDLSQYAELERGDACLHREPTGLSAAIFDVVHLLTRHATHKGLSLEVSFLGPVPESIETDRARLRQILIQLLGNAVKQTTRGQIQVVVELATPAHSTAPRLRIAVSDTGAGVAPDLRPHLFDPFHFDDNTARREASGTRLGLAIAHRTALLLGGDLTCESDVGRGSTFVLTIPTGPLDAVRLRCMQPLLEPLCVERTAPLSNDPLVPTPPAATDLSQTRVLLVEDGLDNQRLIRMILTMAGAAVVIADNGRVACELVSNGPDVNAFDLILMDIQMPEMDGYEATRRLRQMGCTRPIVALTSLSQPADRQNCLAAGCDDYLTKPVSRAVLLKTLAAWRATLSQPMEPVA